MHIVMLLVSFALGFLPAEAAEPKRNLFEQVSVKPLSNHLTLYHVQIPDAAVFKFSIYVWAGSADETKGTNEGIAHLVEHLLFQQKGTPEANYENVLSELGGSYNAFTYKAHTNYFVNLPKAHLQAGLRWLWQVVFNPTLSQGEIDRQRFAGAVQIIADENRWATPEWYHRLAKLFYPPRYLRPAGFWQQHFDLPEFDRPVSGDRQVANRLTVDDALAFYRRFYNTQNMAAIYAGPHSRRQVEAILQPLIDENRGLTAGGLNIRPYAELKRGKSNNFRYISFNDETPQITLGHLLRATRFEEIPRLILYSEAMESFLQEKIRGERSQSYGVESSLQNLRGSGFVAFTSAATRLSFPLIKQFMQQSLWEDLETAIDEAHFEKTQRNLVAKIEGRLHQPNYMESYLGFLLREHPEHHPAIEQLNWLGTIQNLTFEDLRSWMRLRLNPRERYEYLESPSLLLPYDSLPLIALTMIVAGFFWKRLILRPAHIRGVRYLHHLPLLPFAWMRFAGALYCGYWLLIHAYFFGNRLLDRWVDQGLSLYLSTYGNLVVSAFFFVSIVFIAGRALPTKLLITRDRLTVTFLFFHSRSILLKEIAEVREIGWLRQKTLRVQSKAGRPLFFTVENTAAIKEVISIAVSSETDDVRQIPLPGLYF